VHILVDTRRVRGTVPIPDQLDCLSNFWGFSPIATVVLVRLSIRGILTSWIPATVSY
jgi:hypothetical protein